MNCISNTVVKMCKNYNNVMYFIIFQWQYILLACNSDDSHEVQSWLWKMLGKHKANEIHQSSARDVSCILQVRILNFRKPYASGYWQVFHIFYNSLCTSPSQNDKPILCGFTWMKTNQATVQILRTPAHQKI